MLSVLMAIYHGTNPADLALCLESLACQTRPAEEIVIVEDGQVPVALQKTLEAYLGRLPIRIERIEQNSGLGAALNFGLKQCTYDLVARMDSDDIARIERFEKQLAAFASDDRLDILSGYACEIDDAGNRGGVRRVPTAHREIVGCIWANPIIHPAVMYRRQKIIAVGSYDTTLRRRQDYELWFRCALAGYIFGNLPEVLIDYRFTPDTHKRQSKRELWQQAVVGFKGARALGLPMHAQLASVVPFMRGLLPQRYQHSAYQFLKRFDPRSRS